MAKEIQLLNPERFGNIFLCLGGFHFEKVLIACCGKYLEETGVDTILIANEVYGQENVNIVLNGGDYVRGSRCMAIISEVLQTLRMNQFLEKVNPNVFADVDELAKEMIGAIKNPRNQTTDTQCNHLSTVIVSSYRSEAVEIFQDRINVFNKFIPKFKLITQRR